jgi:hypothetical protein
MTHVRTDSSDTEHMSVRILDQQILDSAQRRANSLTNRGRGGIEGEGRKMRVRERGVEGEGRKMRVRERGG